MSGGIPITDYPKVTRVSNTDYVLVTSSVGSGVKLITYANLIKQIKADVAR